MFPVALYLINTINMILTILLSVQNVEKDTIVILGMGTILKNPRIVSYRIESYRRQKNRRYDSQTILNRLDKRFFLTIIATILTFNCQKWPKMTSNSAINLDFDTNDSKRFWRFWIVTQKSQNRIVSYRIVSRFRRFFFRMPRFKIVSILFWQS